MCYNVFQPSLVSDDYPEVAAELKKELDNVVITQNLQSSTDIINAARSQFDPKHPILLSSETKTNRDVELAVQVQVEQSVLVEYPPQDRREHDRKPSYSWGSR